MRRTLISALMVCGWITPSPAHDIPDARVDRSIQAILGPSKLRIDYEVGLSELTLIQDLRSLDLEVPGGDREGWFRQYGRATGPLNAKGVLVSVDGVEIELVSVGFDLRKDAHPRFVFHFEAVLPARGRLAIIDTNFLSSEGTSRLALRPIDGVEVQGDSLPGEVERVEIRPKWQLSDVEERRTRRLTVDYKATSASSPQATTSPISRPAPAIDGLSSLLDRVEGRRSPGLWLMAILLGAAHAIQPGHGKTIVAASTAGSGGDGLRGAWLGLATSMVHMISVALIAAALWVTRTSRPAEVHLILARVAGFAIAAIGLWRIGRHLGRYGEHVVGHSETHRQLRGMIPVALAGGIVPCWDAVALVMFSEAIGRLALGLGLLLAFSLGMAMVLMLVGGFAGRLRGASVSRGWSRRFGLAGGLVLAGIGLSMMAN